MYEYEDLNYHKKSDSIKWILTLVAFILVGIMLLGIILGWFDKKEPAKETQTSTAQTGGMVVGEEKGNGIALLSAVIPVEQYTDYGIATIAETAYTLTATITPFDADNQQVDWAVAFVNPSSTWANGKTVTDYVTVTPASDGARSASVQCLKAFGEQIKITVTSRENSSATAQCTADYVKRIVSVDITMGTSTSYFHTQHGGGGLNILHDSFSNASKPVLAPKYSDYTKDATYTLNYMQFEFDRSVRDKYCKSSVPGGYFCTDIDRSFSRWDINKALTVSNIVNNCIVSCYQNNFTNAKNMLVGWIKSSSSNMNLGKLTFLYTSTTQGATECSGYCNVMAPADVVTVFVEGVTVNQSNLLF